MHWPYIVIHSHLTTLRHAAGWTLGPIILINPDYRGCPDILVHERVHVAQWWRYMLKLSPVLFAIGRVWYWFRAVQSRRHVRQRPRGGRRTSTRLSPGFARPPTQVMPSHSQHRMTTWIRKRLCFAPSKIIAPRHIMTPPAIALVRAMAG